MSHPPYRVASRWGVYDPDGVLVYITSHHEEDQKNAWTIFTGWGGTDEIADYERRGYRCIKVYVTPR